MLAPTSPFAPFTDQFVLGIDLAWGPEGWIGRTLKDWRLWTPPGLQVLDILAEDGRKIGWLIGDLISPEGVFLAQAATVPAADKATIEHWLAQHGGRFVSVWLDVPTPRFDVDAAATMAAVYALDEPLIASTVTLLSAARSQGQEIFRQGENVFPAGRDNLYFPAGLTALPNVRRIMPNHHLDLPSWKVVRHWPLGPIDPAPDSEAESLMAEISRHTRAALQAVARRGQGYCGLTAGHDSRALLACSVPDSLSFYTFNYETSRGRRRNYRADVQIATLIAQRRGLEHRIINTYPPSDELKRDYLFRIGYTGNWKKSEDFDAAFRDGFDFQRTLLYGFGAEVARAYFWHAVDHAEELTPTELLCRQSREPRFEYLPAMEEWRHPLVGYEAPQLLDLFYLEQRIGCWASCHLYGTAPFRTKLVPLAHPQIFRAMFRLPVEFRHKNRFGEALIRQNDPELLSLPFQDFTGWPRVLDRIAGFPKKARSFLGGIRRRLQS